MYPYIGRIARSSLELRGDLTGEWGRGMKRARDGKGMEGGKGKEEEGKERGVEFGGVCVIGFRGNRRPWKWRELQLVFVHPHFIRRVIWLKEAGESLVGTGTSRSFSCFHLYSVAGGR